MLRWVAWCRVASRLFALRRVTSSCHVVCCCVLSLRVPHETFHYLKIIQGALAVYR